MTTRIKKFEFGDDDRLDVRLGENFAKVSLLSCEGMDTMSLFRGDLEADPEDGIPFTPARVRMARRIEELIAVLAKAQAYLEANGD